MARPGVYVAGEILPQLLEFSRKRRDVLRQDELVLLAVEEQERTLHLGGFVHGIERLAAAHGEQRRRQALPKVWSPSAPPFGTFSVTEARRKATPKFRTIRHYSRSRLANSESNTPL